MEGIRRSPSAARLTLLYIWRLPSPAPERGSPPGEFLMPGDVKFDAHVAPLVLAHPGASSDSQNSGSIPQKRRFFGPFLGFDLSSFALKNQFVFSV